MSKAVVSQPIPQRGTHRRLAQSYTFAATADVAFVQQCIEHDEQIQVDVPKIQGRLLSTERITNFTTPDGQNPQREIIAEQAETGEAKNQLKSKHVIPSRDSWNINCRLDALSRQFII